MASDPPAAGRRGDSFAVGDTVMNRGNALADPSRTRYFLSDDRTDRRRDQPLQGERAVPALAPLMVDSGVVQVTITDKTAPGTYYVLACADGRHDVPESDEQNNCIASDGTITVTP